MAPANETPLRRFHGLDTLRAVAIVAVMLYHLSIQGLLPVALDRFAAVGWAGVDLFFVLSGFLIGSQLLRPYVTGATPSLRDFYARRAYRILPAYFTVLCLYVTVPMWREAPGPYAPWQYVSFTWNLLLLHYPEARAFSHVWSLCVEEHFYLILPLLVVIRMRRPAVWKTFFLALGIVLGEIVLRAWILHHLVAAPDVPVEMRGRAIMRFIYYPTYTRLDGLVAGVSLAVLHLFRPSWWSRVQRFGDALLIAGVAAVVGALWLCGFDFVSADLPASVVFTFPLLAIGFALLVAAATGDRGLLTRRVPGARPLATLAFSLYLTHKSVAHAVHRLLPSLTARADWASAGIYASACLSVATLLYFGVERPFLSLRFRRSEKRRTVLVDREVRLDPAI